jgi:hypothetical protein
MRRYTTGVFSSREERFPLKEYCQAAAEELDACGSTKMAISSNEQVVFRDYPLWLWLPGMMAIALTLPAWMQFKAWERLLFALMGVALIGFASILTVTVDRQRGTVNLRYRSLFRVSTQTYPLSEICFVNVAEDPEGERMYRVELILWPGQAVPLRNGYSIGRWRHERRAQRLRSALRIPSEGPAIRIALRPQRPKR